MSQKRENLKVIEFKKEKILSNFNSESEEVKELKFRNKTIKKKPGKNFWWVRYRKDGKQYAIYASTQAECLEKLKQVLKVEEKHRISNDNTLKSWFDKWLNTYKVNKVRETTVVVYQRLFKHLESYENLKLNKFNEILINELLDNIKLLRTKQKIFDLLSQLFKKAVINNLIKINPIIDLERPKYKAPEEIIMNMKEEETFIKACRNNEFGDFYLLCLFQGLRKGECLALKRNDIDFKNRTLRIDESINNGTKNTDTKNESSKRTMPIFDNTLEILKKYENLSPEENLFKFSANVYQKNFKVILKNNSIRDVKIHSLRHSFITRCVEFNIAEHIIQSWVGHTKDSKVTKTVYTHLREETNTKYLDIYNNKIKPKK